MANKPIIDIEVKDETFRKFYDLFKEYSEKVEELPEAWKKLGDAMGGGLGKFNSLSKQSKDSMAIAAASATIIVEEIRKATHAQRQLHTATRHTHGAMKDLASSAAKVGKTLFGIGKFMFGFGGLTSRSEERRVGK